MTALEKAIAESKKREENATGGPWRTSYHPCTNGPAHRSIRINDIRSNHYDNLDFIAASRTWEPRWREMVEILLERVMECFCANGISCRNCLVRDVLERLAKEGLEQ